MATLGFLVALILLIPTWGLSLVVYFGVLVAHRLGANEGARLATASGPQSRRSAQPLLRASDPVPDFASTYRCAPKLNESAEHGEAVNATRKTITDLVLESSEKREAVGEDGLNETDVEIFFSMYLNEFPVEHQQHRYGSARCGWLLLDSGCVYCACVVTIGNSVVVMSSGGTPMVEFALKKSRIAAECMAFQRVLLNTTLEHLEQLIAAMDER